MSTKDLLCEACGHHIHDPQPCKWFDCRCGWKIIESEWVRPSEWVRVHSDADEGKSDEEFLTRNLLREMIEKYHGIPQPMYFNDAATLFWESEDGERWEVLVNEYAEKIAREWEEKEE